MAKTQEQWTMGSEAVGGGFRRRSRVRAQARERERLAKQAKYGVGQRLADLALRAKSLVSIEANEELIRRVPRKLSAQQREKLAGGVVLPQVIWSGAGTVVSLREEASTTVRSGDTPIWSINLGVDLLDELAPPDEVVTGAVNPHAIAWQEQSFGDPTTPETRPLDPNISQLRGYRRLIEKAIDLSVS